MPRFALSHCLLAAVALALCGCKNMGNKGGAGAGAYGSDSDTVTGSALPERQEGVSFMSANVDRHKFQPIYFDFDSYAVTSIERSKIQEVAAWSRENPNTIILAGFTDERGTPEYNRVLGERRALAVREALIRAGAKGGSLQTVSFGAEMPASNGTSEADYAKNRRVEFGVVRGAGSN
jgi:peptidoglycan-associated lipoprotein